MMLTLHGPLVIHAVHSSPSAGITRIDVRCPRCGRQMHIERNGKLLPDVQCLRDEVPHEATIPQIPGSALHGGPLADDDMLPPSA